MRSLVLVLTACALGAGSASAADVAAPSPFAPPPQPGFLSEFRLGGFAHDPWSPERGGVDVNAELLFAKPWTLSTPLANAFVPRAHIGTTINTRGDTSVAYAGLTWTFDMTQRIFLEGTLGGALNNGVAGFTPVGRSAMGCHASFRESASLGYRFTESFSLMATVEHMSNAGICSDNRGLTNAGLRLGYSF